MAAVGHWHIDIFPWMRWSHKVNGGTIVRENWNNALSMAMMRQGTVAQNDEIGWDVQLTEGTWNLTVIYYKSTDRGIQTWKLDGTTLGTIDGYAASESWNNVTQITGFTVSTSGIYTLKCVMATKNASSSNYYYSLQVINLMRTA